MVLPKMPLTGRPLADVAVYGVQKRTGGRIKRPWVVRWALDGRQRSRSFRTRPEADRYRSGLLVAQQSGERFDNETGEPESWQPLPDQAQVHLWARRWLGEQWPDWAPRTRSSAVEALTRFVPLAVPPTAPPAPAGVRAHLASWLPPGGGATGDSTDDSSNDSTDDEAAVWLSRWGLQLGQLNRSVLATVNQALGARDDGEPLAPSTAARFRKVSRACIRRAVDLGVIDVDPWPPAPRGRSQRKAARTKRQVSVRSLPGPDAMRRAIEAIPNHQPASRTYQVMTAVAYYAGLRPSEVVMLRAKALHLPAKGWGRIDVTEADVSFDEPGEPKTGPRSVPIPRHLVELLDGWVESGGHAGDDLLFRTRAGLRPTSSNWSRSLRRALEKIDHPPMRIYDCRHAAATTWLKAGVPLGEVARRMGHSVETLVSTYVGALDGDETVANERIDAVLGTAKVTLATPNKAG